MRNKVTSITNLFADTSIHDAGLLDIPFIFDLIVRGSMDGSFTDAFISSSGYFTILSSLFLSHRFFLKLKSICSRNDERFYHMRKELLIFSDHGEPIGFLQVINYQDKNNNFYKLIDLCAIKYGLRGQGYGKCMISKFLEMQPPDTEIRAYCNKYAKGMQHIFKKMHFRRTSVGRGLNLFTLGKSDAKTLLPLPNTITKPHQFANRLHREHL
ncbi:GNAT family N-acetyltransferase [Collimonas sp. NPDC087041]|uniref:GNAT family N-acetyltransferase n=1 Tax=Collimonas sp. NPDC087041 TaxID=3363960 RepID=UPI00382ED7D5